MGKSKQPDYIEIKDKSVFIRNNRLGILDIEFIKYIGGGANADTFLVYNKLLCRNEVVKVWHENARRGELDICQVLAEFAKNGKASSIENVATFYDAGKLNSLFYAREEYIQGITLNDYLKKSPELCCRSTIAENLLITMKKVYDTGLYHGDLHSDNVIVREDDIPVIIDFGTSILSGKEYSHKRDCRNLVRLFYDVIPEAKNISFIAETNLIEHDSMKICFLLLNLNELVWDLYGGSSMKNQDSYGKMSFALFLKHNFIDEFSFLDPNEVYLFYKEVAGEIFPSSAKSCVEF